MCAVVVLIVLSLSLAACSSGPGNTTTVNPASPDETPAGSSTVLTTSAQPHPPKTEHYDVPLDEISRPQDASLRFIPQGTAHAGEVFAVALRNDHTDEAKVRVSFFEGKGTIVTPSTARDGGNVTIAGHSTTRLELVVEEPSYIELLAVSLRNPNYQVSTAIQVVE